MLVKNAGLQFTLAAGRTPSRRAGGGSGATDAREVGNVAGVRRKGLFLGRLLRWRLLLLLSAAVRVPDVIPGSIPDNEPGLASTLLAWWVHVVAEDIVLFNLVTHVLHLKKSNDCD